MNEIWSKKIQGIKTLDNSRMNRFRDDKKDILLELIGAKKSMKIVELGCGPGTLARKIVSWLNQECDFTGIDLDTNFINYANEVSKKMNLNCITFKEGDVTKTDINDNTFDISYSHTVIEHVPNKEFLLEQKRIVKEGGKVTVMITLGSKTMSLNNNWILKQSDRELELLEPFSKCFEENDNKYLKKHFVGIDELAKLFEESGFKNVNINSMSFSVTADNDSNSLAEKMSIIKEQYLDTYEEMIDLGVNILHDKVSNEHVEELKNIIREKYNRRIEILSSNKKIWDYKIYTTIFISGIV